MKPSEPYSKERIMKAGIIKFPGTTCDNDLESALGSTGFEPSIIWYNNYDQIDYFDLIVLPGGYSFGDKDGAGKIASQTAIAKEIISYVQNGGLLLGICNGCQILSQMKLISGKWDKNKSHRFIQKYVYLRVENDNTPFTNFFQDREVVKLHIAHYSGVYTPDDSNSEIDVAFRYCDENGEVSEKSNPQGSYMNIAGVFGKNRQILGMMPHPERCIDYLFSTIDGRKLFLSLINYLENRKRK